MAVYLSCFTIKGIYIVVLFVNNTFLMFESSVLPLKVMASLHKYILLLNNSTFNNIQCDAQGDFFLIALTVITKLLFHT